LRAIENSPEDHIWTQEGLSNCKADAWPENNKEESEMNWVKWWKEDYVHIYRKHIKLNMT